MMWVPRVEKIADVVACLSSDLGMPSTKGVVGSLYFRGIGSVMSTRYGLSSKRETTKRLRL